MNFDNQILLFFSALGAFNGLIVSIYFFIIARQQQYPNYFLSFLLLMVTIRVTKSIFFYFNPQLSTIFLQLGISACILIGPLLYMYLKSMYVIKKPRWHIHCIPFLVIIIVVGTIWPYTAYSEYWSKWVMKAIYLQWFIYLATSFKFIKPVFKNNKALKGLSRTDLWCLSVYFGITLIWLAYIFGAYTSYIVGAISFTFILYIIGLLLALNVSKTSLFFKQKEKYNNKTITQEKAREIENSISILIDKELFLKPNITLSEFSSSIKITKHTLSQYLNEQKGKSFNRFINELRVEKAKEYLVVKHNYTMESIGYDSGFNSKSTFFKAFKKVTGLTPLEYQKRNAR